MAREPSVGGLHKVDAREVDHRLRMPSRRTRDHRAIAESEALREVVSASSHSTATRVVRRRTSADETLLMILELPQSPPAAPKAIPERAAQR